MGSSRRNLTPNCPPRSRHHSNAAAFVAAFRLALAYATSLSLRSIPHRYQATPPNSRPLEGPPFSFDSPRVPVPKQSSLQGGQQSEAMQGGPRAREPGTRELTAAFVGQQLERPGADIGSQAHGPPSILAGARLVSPLKGGPRCASARLRSVTKWRGRIG